MRIAVAVNPQASFGRRRTAGSAAVHYFRSAGEDVLELRADSAVRLEGAVRAAPAEGIDALVAVRGDVPAACRRIAVARVTGGRPMRITPAARVDDGLLDLFIVKPLSRAAFLAVFPKVFSGLHLGHPAVEIRQVRKVRISAVNVQADADGERIGTLPHTIEVVPGAVRVVA